MGRRKKVYGVWDRDGSDWVNRRSGKRIFDGSNSPFPPNVKSEEDVMLYEYQRAESEFKKRKKAIKDRFRKMRSGG